MEDIKRKLGERYLAIRRCHYLVWTEEFLIVYEKASEKEKETLAMYFDDFNDVAIKSFLKRKQNELTSLDKMSTRQLRRVAKYQKIDNYWNKSKQDLIKDLTDIAKRLKNAPT
jgi:hypothetical protein